MMLYYYWVKFIIDRKEYFLIWVCDDKDYFITENGELIFFEKLSNAQKFAKEMGLNISEDIDVYNIDEYVPKDKDSVDCNATLNLWNILSDFAASVKVPFEGDDVEYNTTYGKLVYGCNLPALMNDYHYDPTWNDEEIADINKILASGIDILYNNLVLKKPFDQSLTS